MSVTTIYRGGEERVLGCLPRQTDIGSLAFAPHYSEKFTLLPRDKWKPLKSLEEIKRYIDNLEADPVTNQNGIGSCGANAAVEALFCSRMWQGLDVTKRFAFGRLYHYSGGGRDQGSMLSDNLKYITTIGVPLVKDRTQEMNWKSSYTVEEKAEAISYRISAAADCPDFEAMATAVQTGWDVEHGIDVGRNYEVDASGIWIRNQSGSGGGHAQCTPAGGLCWDATHGFGLLVPGSWGTNFGYKGWYIVPEGYFLRGDFVDGWASRAAVVPENEQAPPA